MKTISVWSFVLWLIILPSRAFGQNLVGQSWLQERVGSIYVVKPVQGWLPWGGAVAKAFNMTLRQLGAANNHIADWDHLRVGAIIFIPKVKPHISSRSHWMVTAVRRQTTLTVDQFMASKRPSRRYSPTVLIDQPRREKIVATNFVWVDSLLRAGLIILWVLVIFWAGVTVGVIVGREPATIPSQSMPNEGGG